MKFEVMCLALLGSLFFCSRVSASSDIFTELLHKKLSPQWNEDLEPELEKIMKRVRKETLPIANEIISDEAMDADCLQTLTRIAKGMREYELWAMKCKWSALISKHFLSMLQPLDFYSPYRYSYAFIF